MLEEAHVYDPRDEHASCGVGFIASIDGTPRRDVVVLGIEALKAVWHRGAVDADGKTGDGAGIHVQVPQNFFRKKIAENGHTPPLKDIAVGMIFLPRIDFAAQETCRGIVEGELMREGYGIYGWRRVPVDPSVCGEKGNANRPEIEQIIVDNVPNHDSEHFNRTLFVVRRRIEKAVTEARIQDFYICSLSSRSLIYKGMFLAEHLDDFYPDLCDPEFTSTFSIYHQRYSTNTFPTWKLAQPFRTLAHNGEINTFKGNQQWMRAHEPRMAHEHFDEVIEDILPIIPAGASDSQALDAAFEVMTFAGRDAPMVKTMLLPEAWLHNHTLSDQVRDMYSFVNGVIEAWDGPAAIAASDGRWILGGLDRNGLRPLRYSISADGLLIAGSETGMVHLDEDQVTHKGSLGPGEMIAVDLLEGKLWSDHDLKTHLALRHPYGEWLKEMRTLSDLVESTKISEAPTLTRKDLLQRQVAFNISLEDMELTLQPMVEQAKEPIGSMGDDTPLAILSKNYRSLHHFFRQDFSQVTNPPIDSLRERSVMTLTTRLGNLGNILDDSKSQGRLIQLSSPVVTNGEYECLRNALSDSLPEIDCTYDKHDGPNALQESLERIRTEAETFVQDHGAEHLFLSDRAMSETRVAIPMILAVAALHSHLIRKRLRTNCSLNVRTAECFDPHYFAILIGCGASTVNAWLAQEAIADRHARGLFPDFDLQTCINRFRTAIDEGLLKIMSKMGVSVLSSYRGGCMFEAVGLSRSVAREYFTSLTSRISGIGLSGLQHRSTEQHAKGMRNTGSNVIALPVGGFHRYRAGSECHGYEAELIHLLQAAVRKGQYKLYKQYSQAVTSRPPLALRHLFEFASDRPSLVNDNAESITSIRKRFVTPGMSLGALSPEAHGALNIAMNRIGGRSDSGEGGEFEERFTPSPNGDNANSRIKQVASGRFGVTAEYLNQCDEIEIKVAQGAKPGEGGQLPGFKVTDLIAKLRHATPGVGLISPPPHHDIYSIEDLAQLIYDLKQINPIARVCVKLVARTGIGTIAAGVAKAHADVILISGHNGGTGASPQTSIKYAGLPWEMGLSEVHQVLTLNRLRHRVTLRTDGGIRTGRDVVMAAMLGAEEYGVGTTSLVAMGCIMVRQCHSNTCPVGVCVQDEKLREKFQGTPDNIVNLFSFIAEEVHEILTELGYSSIKEIIGRSDLLRQVSRGTGDLDDLDLNALLSRIAADGEPQHRNVVERNPVPDTLDKQILKDAAPFFRHAEKMQLAYSVRNTHRSIGTRLSAEITRTYGRYSGNYHEFLPDHIVLKLRGSAGQSLGAFCVRGVKIQVFGDANDYVGKGLSGGMITLRPRVSSSLETQNNVIIGNTVLYGATSGEVFASGRAGQRFCVRNSGADVVVEGCGANGCEYMTGGTVVILGNIGPNFAAGMSGGLAFIYDPHRTARDQINLESVHVHPVSHPHYDKLLKNLVHSHVQETESKFAENLLNHWKQVCNDFVQVTPKEIADKLAIWPLPKTPAHQPSKASKKA